ncbi:MAG TPA: type I-U CRISPR-associated helicase/endonuclease Cas3 [Bryobacteraceae bacterium]|nr:type I-U CRISPR-associated helicase/endonuclease Cas3 [Bryobacteraceae bacterium]
MTDFPSFFRALWTSQERPEPQPFPWQTMIAERAAAGEWPKAINLPTASGKTACLDAAVFGLAATAGRPTDGRLPRRIWFVVDRRIVVDEAFERAKMIASRLAHADGGPMGEVAQSLRSLSGTARPLAVARLRGGAWTSRDWTRRPSQPTIICSTVDQVGSALLFRAYGHSDETASIYAGLAAHDSLIILDEAHCAVPFLQTLDAVARYREGPWGERPLKTPFRYCLMSATPPDSIHEAAMFPRASERAAALDHPLLQKRIRARKLATLGSPVKGGDEEFVSAAAKLAQKYQEQAKLRVAVMVNRVATARKIADQLRKNIVDAAGDVVLLTGRVRPLDRDVLVARWKDVLKAGSTEALQKPVIVVTTQCLEVGADFSFDALVTECASLDALRQRFGRLDRLGESGESNAAILIRERDTKAKSDADPIYGKAIYETWTWLNQAEQRLADGRVDFGFAALGAHIDALRAVDAKTFRRLLAPSDDAPVLLPAHLDLLCQTSPRPTPEPDVALFLHGKGQQAPEIRVVFRADLKGEPEDIETLSLVPPTSPEVLAVPLHRLKKWFLQDHGEETDADVEGVREENDTNAERAVAHKFVIWRGRQRSEVTGDIGRLRPNETVVLPLSRQGISELGQIIDAPEGLGPDRLDLAEHAFSQARGRTVLRVHRDVLEPLCGHESVANLVALGDSDPAQDEIQAALRAVLDEDDGRTEDSEQVNSGFLPKWLKEIVVLLLADHRFRIEDHPAGGVILIGRTKQDAEDAEDDQFADAEDLTSEAPEPISWEEHTASVNDFAGEFAARCLDNGFSDAIVAAAQAHDLGKLDWRFQLLLHGGDWAAISASPPLAKSADVPERKRTRQEIQQDARLPKGFRHEFLSMQLAEHFGLVPPDEEMKELVLHLIASHHGCARPFAPCVPDKLVTEGLSGDLCLSVVRSGLTLRAAERRAMAPPHRVDSGVAERFWRLTRRYGWWGLAYLEGIFRLSDWEASRGRGHQKKTLPFTIPQSSRAALSRTEHRIALDALDCANPLAFLAALGALRVLTRVLPEYSPRLSWEQRVGAWRPVLWTSEPLDKARICEALSKNGLDIMTMFSDDLLSAAVAASPKNKKGEASWKDKLKFPVGPFRVFCRAMSDSRSVSAEFAAAWAGETELTPENVALRTRFDFTAGQQAFAGMLRELKDKCDVRDLQRSLFTGWRYSTGVSMRWDTQDEKRQYALQSSDPTKSSNPPTAERGANFLAVEALPLFPVVPNRGADQAGFEGKGDGRCWSWPAWTYPIGLDVIRSLLAVPLTNSTVWSEASRREVGVAAVFQSRIVMPSGRYRCFTPARNV